MKVSLSILLILFTISFVRAQDSNDSAFVEITGATWLADSTGKGISKGGFISSSDLNRSFQVIAFNSDHEKLEIEYYTIELIELGGEIQFQIKGSLLNDKTRKYLSKLRKESNVFLEVFFKNNIDSQCNLMTKFTLKD